MKNYNNMHFLFLLVIVFMNVHLYAQQKNVLFISVDDLRPELNCYGVSQMVTPNIDALANNGVLFQKAYVQQALCAPSRISMMTGLYPETTEIFDLNTKIDSKPQYKVLSQSFKDNGYECIAAGKIFHSSSDSKSTWSKDPTSYPTKDYALQESINMMVGNFGPPTENANVADNKYSDGKIADNIISELDNLQDKPFFLVAGFMRPHLPFNAPKKYWDMYDENDIVVPSKNSPEGASQYASTQWNELRSYVGMPDTSVDVLTDAQTKKLIHGYRASVSFVDAQIGRIIDKLNDLGLRENTIIVLWGDHGFKLGEQGDWAKHTNYELDTRIPLIISSPGMNTGVSNSPVESVDIYPTLMDLCNLNVSESLEGVSLKKIFEENINHQVRESAYSVYTRQAGDVLGRTIRYGNYRYVEWRNKDNNDLLDKELYDHTNGDIAIENLAYKTAYSSIVEDLSERLNARFGGPGGIIEDSSVKLIQLSNKLTGEWLTAENTGSVSVASATSEVSQWTMTKSGDIATFQNLGTGKYLSADANSNNVIEIDGSDIRSYWKITGVNIGEYHIDNIWKIDNGVVGIRMQVSNGNIRLVDNINNLGPAVIWIENPIAIESPIQLQNVGTESWIEVVNGQVELSATNNTNSNSEWKKIPYGTGFLLQNSVTNNYLASEANSRNVIVINTINDHAVWQFTNVNGDYYIDNKWKLNVGDAEARMKEHQGQLFLLDYEVNTGALAKWSEEKITIDKLLMHKTTQSYLTSDNGIKLTNNLTGDESKWEIIQTGNNIAFKNKANGNYLASDSSSNNVVEVGNITDNALWIKTPSATEGEYFIDNQWKLNTNEFARLKYYNGDIHLSNNDVAFGNDVRWLFDPENTLSNSSIEKRVNDPKVLIFPNPSTGLFNIQASANYSSWQLSDMNGRLLNQGTMNTNSSMVNAKSNKGLLFLSLKSTNGKLAKTIKVIIK